MAQSTVVPRVCDVIGGPWDGDRQTARSWPIEVRSERGPHVLGRYVLVERATRGPGGQIRRTQEWHWEPEAA